MQGGCYCGSLRYEVTADPVMKAQCHCRECQYISGGGPNFFMIVPNDGFRFTRGAPASFARSDLEQPRTRQFCPTCGTHVTTLLPQRPLTVLKVGTLDDRAGDGDLHEGQPAFSCRTRGHALLPGPAAAKMMSRR